MREHISELIEAADLNALLRAVDSLCEARDWDALVDVANACEAALERGKQLWPISVHVDHRLALEAPGDFAASVLHADPARTFLGPLTEVAASTHKWTELAGHIESPLVAAYVAQERVLRGEILEGDPRAHPEALELPLRMLDYEPTYALATYAADHVEVSEPWPARTPLAPAQRRRGEVLNESELTNALLDLVTPWTNESNGAARAVVVEGDAVSAISELALDEVRVAALDRAEALQRIAWAAASGGAHGRRRGAALGRFMALYTATLLVDVPWPGSLQDLGELLDELDFVVWDEGAVEQGWVLRIAVADTARGWAAAIAATDLLEEATGSAG